MAEVGSELIYEIVKNLQQRTSNVELLLLEHGRELQALRGHSTSVATDVNNIHAVLSRMDGRLDHIEKRLELREFAEGPQAPFSPV